MTTDEHDTTLEPAPRPTGRWVGKSALIMPALLVVVGLFLVYGIVDMEIADDSEIFGPRSFPAIAAAFCFVIAALLTVSILRHPEIPDAPVDDNGQPISGPASNWRATGITIGSFVVFTVLLVPAGWIIAGAVVFWGVTVGLGSTKYVANLLIGLALSSIVQLVFGGLLGLTLPPGVMGLF
ncbi:tripartite tricarboxylate transporter TctB family protein [Rhodococcus artemisiae]|uniref:Tripartite tricarboxylate transporter TctB family protein n=1 Tax=Rhodococcus artemisiae TaxID=714159 RepID=A0ABU7LB72_9NOCA|nr:tripartite tricarboxylate transporter TctB family protein [Rhodococcus artemisiae]MEE2058800.1 tripartite tricarboxylate transporter TctB family protein [Rhodococcus artemisiae]